MKKILSFTLIIQLLSFNVFAETEEDQFGEGGNLTDQQRLDAQNFVHQGQVQKEYDEACKDQGNLCTDGTYAFKGEGWQTLEQMVPVVSKAYSMFFGMTGSKIQMKPKKDAPTNSNGKKEGDEKQDLCAFIPMVTEMGATAFQAIQQNQIENTEVKPESIQEESLYQVARTHDARAKSADMQFYGWTATGACYAAYLIGGAKPNFSNIGKMSAAALLATFYKISAEAHKERSAEIIKIAEGMPGKGDCNPFTKTHCFCSEKTSFQFHPSEYQTACIPKDYHKQPPVASGASCVDQNKKIDHSCQCKKTNSCMIDSLMMGAASLPFGASLVNGPFQALDYLKTGNFDSGSLNNAAQANSAFTKRVMDGIKNVEDLPKMNLDDNQKKTAKALNDLGVPAGVAAGIAASPQTGGQLPSSMSDALASLKSNSPINFPSGSGYKGIQSASNGYKPNSGSLSGRRDSSNTNSAPVQPTKGDGVEVLEFADMAVKEADITKAPEKMLFDIISNRYRGSAWNKFEDQMKLEEKTAE
jgi:hypothetical protein